MDLRTQLVIVGLVGLAWGGGRWMSVRPVVDTAREVERMSLAALESRVARSPDDVVATRGLLRRYLDHGMTRLVVDTAQRAPERVQRDGDVTLSVARAQEALGQVDTAYAVTQGALARCGAVPAAMAEHAGCDVRTQTALAFQAAALERMRRWRVTPISDPARASLAHGVAAPPGGITGRGP